MTETEDPAIRLLKHRRQEAVWLANQTGIDAERIRRIGRGASSWTPLERQAVARAFDIPVDVLFVEAAS